MEYGEDGDCWAPSTELEDFVLRRERHSDPEAVDTGDICWYLMHLPNEKGGRRFSLRPRSNDILSVSKHLVNVFPPPLDVIKGQIEDWLEFLTSCFKDIF